MPINIYSVRNHLEQEGWTLLSESYKNLNTELEMCCPAGHLQRQTYGNWRKHQQCEECMAGDPYKIKQDGVLTKGENVTRVIGLDAATGITGYAIYDDGELVSYGTHKTDSRLSTEERINDMKKWLIAAIDEWNPSFVGIENVQLQKFGPHSSQTQVKTFQTLSNLQGVILDTLFEKCIDHDLVYASEWRSYCGINEGDQHRENKKKLAQEKVKAWYHQDCTQDEADAICIGKYFAHIIKNSKSSWGEDIE